MLTAFVYHIQLKKQKKVREKVGFSVKRIGILKLLMPHGVLGSLLKVSKFIHYRKKLIIQY